MSLLHDRHLFGNSEELDCGATIRNFRIVRFVGGAVWVAEER